MDDLKKMLRAGGVKTKLVFISSSCSENSGNAFVEAGKKGQSVHGEISVVPLW